MFSVLMPELSNGRALPDPTSDPGWMKVIKNDPRFWKGGDKAAFSNVSFHEINTMKIDHVIM